MPNADKVMARLLMGANPVDSALAFSSPDKSNIDFGFGSRHDSQSKKGLGYFGQVQNSDGGFSTEISSFDNMAAGEYPLMVPTLTRDEMAGLLSGNPSQSVYEKASKHAEIRKMIGKSPFAEFGENTHSIGDLK